MTLQISPCLTQWHLHCGITCLQTDYSKSIFIKGCPWPSLVKEAMTPNFSQHFSLFTCISYDLWDAFPQLGMTIRVPSPMATELASRPHEAYLLAGVPALVGIVYGFWLSGLKSLSLTETVYRTDHISIAGDKCPTIFYKKEKGDCLRLSNLWLRLTAAGGWRLCVSPPDSEASRPVKKNPLRRDLNWSHSSRLVYSKTAITSVLCCFFPIRK